MLPVVAVVVAVLANIGAAPAAHRCAVLLIPLLAELVALAAGHYRAIIELAITKQMVITV
jgi:hypothetical protein